MEEELIEAVRKHKVLYDTRDPGYMKSKMKDELWNNIACELQLANGNAAKSIWQKLRNNHREALRRQKQSFKSGAAATPIKQWRYQKQMDFLLPYMINRARESNLDIEGTQSTEETRNNTDIEEVESPGTEVDDADIESQSALGNELNDTHGSEREEGAVVYNAQTESTVSEPTKKHHHNSNSQQKTKTTDKRLKKDNICTMLQESMKQREKRAQERTVERAKVAEPKDELYHFFMSMYQITKKMSPMYQLFTRTAVFNAVSQVEAQSLQINVHTSPQTYVQPSYPQYMHTSRNVLRPEEQHGSQRPWTSRPISSTSDNSDQISSVSNFQFATNTNSQWSTVSIPMTSPEDLNSQDSTTGNVRNFLQNFSA